MGGDRQNGQDALRGLGVAGGAHDVGSYLFEWHTTSGIAIKYFLAALGQVCFKCGKEMHTPECPVAKCGNAIRAAKAKPA